MYLENSEQKHISGEGELSAEAMLAEQCQVPKLTKTADLSSTSTESAELGIKVLVEYNEQTNSREMDSSLCCVEHCNMTRDVTEPVTYCNGHAESFEQYSTSSDVFESDQIGNNCESSELSQRFDECAELCECFKPCKSFELCANDSTTFKCNSCEHCVQHLKLFHQCECHCQQFECFDIKPDELVMNCDSFNRCEMSDFIAEDTDHLEVLQQYEPSDEQYECFDSEPDTSTEDSEQCEMTGSTPDLSDSVDLPDCGSEFCECDDILNQTESANDNYDDLESCPPEQSETASGDEESCRLTEDVNSSFPYCDTPDDIYFDDSEHVCMDNECCGKYLGSKEQQSTILDVSTDHCEMFEIDNSETNQQYDLTLQCQTSDKTSEFGTEEECFSDCSSLETKSFTTCPDGSIPSDHCSDSSGEFDKVVQEDLSDDQTRWESFEEDEQTEQIKTNKSNEDEKTSPTGDIVVEDYFDFFDRADYYRHQFSQKRHYRSCFDGGDIDDCLHLEEAQKCSAENAYTFEEIKVKEAGVSFDVTEETCEISSDESLRGDGDSEKNPKDWSIDLESSLVDNGIEESECESYAQEYEEAEEDADEDIFDGEAFVSEEDFCEICDEEEAEICSSSSNEESMCAPCADDISVEGDAYEDEVYDANIYESLSDNDLIDHGQTTVNDCRKGNEPMPEDKTFIECSEMELYWLRKDNEDVYKPDVEEYYACEIGSIQSPDKQPMNEYIIGGQLYDPVVHGNINRDASQNDGEDANFSLKALEVIGVCPDECKTGSFTVTEITELAANLTNCCVLEKTFDELAEMSDDDGGIHEVSGELGPLQGIIHSVVSEYGKIDGRDTQTDDDWASEQSRDSEEEQSDNESPEPCECEYCIPPTEQVPAKPLLPRMKSNDAGKICVVIDLDETLVHSSFKPVNNADFIIPVEIDGTVHQVYVLKRPHVDEFLKRMGDLFECVLFTASLAKYADPVSDLLDKWGVFRSRLFRESCVFHKGNYVKDLSRLGRDLNKVIIIDNSPASYIFHPDNAVPVASWFDDMSDTELLDLIPFFERLSKEDDIYDILTQQRTSS